MVTLRMNKGRDRCSSSLMSLIGFVSVAPSFLSGSARLTRCPAFLKWVTRKRCSSMPVAYGDYSHIYHQRQPKMDCEDSIPLWRPSRYTFMETSSLTQQQSHWIINGNIGRIRIDEHGSHTREKNVGNFTQPILDDFLADGWSRPNFSRPLC